MATLPLDLEGAPILTDSSSAIIAFKVLSCCNNQEIKVHPVVAVVFFAIFILLES
jgi:hypothetical protein